MKYLEVYRPARRLISKVPPRALRDPRTDADRERKRGSAPAEECFFVGRHAAFSGRLSGALRRSIGHCAHRRRASAAGASFLVVATLAAARVAGKLGFPALCVRLSSSTLAHPLSMSGRGCFPKGRRGEFGCGQPQRNGLIPGGSVVSGEVRRNRRRTSAPSWPFSDPKDSIPDRTGKFRRSCAEILLRPFGTSWRANRQRYPIATAAAVCYVFRSRRYSRRARPLSVSL